MGEICEQPRMITTVIFSMLLLVCFANIQIQNILCEGLLRDYLKISFMQRKLRHKAEIS